MDQKEKITTLVNMGFTVDEALALATGNYRTVPDQNQQPQPQPEPKQPEPQSDPQPEPQQPQPGDRLEQLFTGLQQSISKLEQSIIKGNINESNQPPQQTANDILGLMLEPAKPAERG